jgi:hypothetical protein
VREKHAQRRHHENVEFLSRLCKVRYCGAITDKDGGIVGYLFNDDEVTGGSFAVEPHDMNTDAVLDALKGLRKAFKKGKV